MKIGYIVMEVGVQAPRFLAYDNRGAMASGYPYLAPNPRVAATFDDSQKAQEALDSAIRICKNLTNGEGFAWCRVQELHTTDITYEEF